MPTNIRNDRPLYEPLGALFDMGASATRGVARGTLGLPGDLESLARMIVGGKQVLPTSEDWDKKLPPATPLVADMKPFDDISMFYNVPIYGKALSAGSKGIKKLGGKIVGGETSQSRRNFIKGSAAAGAGTLLASKLKLIDDVLKQVPVEATKPATKEVTKAVSKHKFNSLKEYNDYLNEEALYRADAMAHRYGGSAQDFLKESKHEKAVWDEASYNGAKAKEKELARDFGANWEELPAFQQKELETLDAFSPQAKAEMKQFKQIADEYKWDNAGGKMYDENPHMYNYPDMDTEKLINKYYEKDTTHWSDLLDDYINTKYE